jgi:hypothetical protein
VQDVFVRDRVARTTERASIPSVGGQTNGRSLAADISGNGRYVAFDSDATNLVSDDGNGATDVFVRDRIAGFTTRVSVNNRVLEGNGRSRGPVISADSRHVAFVTDAEQRVRCFARHLVVAVEHRLAQIRYEARILGFSGESQRQSLAALRAGGDRFGQRGRHLLAHREHHAGQTLAALRVHFDLEAVEHPRRAA